MQQEEYYITKNKLKKTIKNSPPNKEATSPMMSIFNFLLYNLKSLSYEGLFLFLKSVFLITTDKNHKSAGKNRNLTRKKPIAIGKNIITMEGNTTAMGGNPIVKGENRNVIGKNAIATEENTIVKGRNRNVTGKNAIAIRKF